MQMRPFTQNDWNAFTGAEGWSADEPPLFGEGTFADGTPYVVVLDRNGGVVVADDEYAAEGGHALDREFDTLDDARTFAESLGAPKERCEFFRAGFKTI